MNIKNQIAKRYLTIVFRLYLLLVLPTSFAYTTGDSVSSSAVSPGISSSSALSDASLLGGAVQFLPVEEAYRLSPRIDGHSLILDWEIAPGYYLYKHQFALAPILSDKGQGTESLALEFQRGRFIYDDYYEKDLEVYYETAQVRVALLAVSAEQADTSLGNMASVYTVRTQGCADAGLCYPPRTEYLSVNVGNGSVEVIPAPALTDAAKPTKSETSGQPSNQVSHIAIALLFAVLGGIILNLMPCVFPVLSIKVMATTSAHLGDHNKHLHSLAYSAGIILSFMGIAAIMLGLRESGQAIGWGFQLQSPVFVALLAYLLFVIAQSFSGQISIGGSWMNVGQNLTQKNSVGSSFMTGVLATVVASPCTAPFMGTALGVALTQSTGLSMAIFAALGFGMALPFLVLSWIPGLMEKLPAPGPWMNTFSQLLAFPLYASVIWLLWVLGRQTSIDHAIVVSLGILLLAFAIWLYGNTKKMIAKGIVVMILAVALSFAMNPEQSSDGAPWRPYSTEVLAELRGDGRAVFVNLTADWCITCLANEKIALSSEAFETALIDYEITYLKGDWTNNNPEITRLLNEHSRSGVPLYLYYDAAGSPVKILPQLLSEKIVLQTLGDH